jgi:hypothetical protein
LSNTIDREQHHRSVGCFIITPIKHLHLSELDVVRDSDVRKQLEILKDHADARPQLRQVRPGIADRCLVHRDGAFLEGLQSVDAFDQLEQSFRT